MIIAKIILVGMMIFCFIKVAELDRKEEQK